jgi:hypothetical protein
MALRIIWKFLLVLITLAIVNARTVSKRDLPDVLTVLESEIKKYPEEDFDKPILVQKVDRTNKESEYRLTNDVHSESMYSRHEDDSNKDIVVFTHEEDKIPFKKTKRLYVVLRKFQPGSLYTPSIAVLRYASSHFSHDMNSCYYSSQLQYLT